VTLARKTTPKDAQLTREFRGCCGHANRGIADMPVAIAVSMQHQLDLQERDFLGLGAISEAI
jgi:hypothetical protein